MTRHEARAQLATWRAIVDDTESPHLRREAVAKLVAVCEWYAAEVERLEHNARLEALTAVDVERTIRELRELLGMARPAPAPDVVFEPEVMNSGKVRPWLRALS
jgi:hypothetical protein